MNIFNLLYEQLLLEAIWNPEIDASIISDPDNKPFSSNVYIMYNLEYKYHILKNSRIVANPKRLENMFNNVKENLIKATEYVQGILLNTMGEWLSSHAILSAKTWATSRINNLFEQEMSDSEIFEIVLSEYDRYRPKSQQTDEYRDLFNNLLANINNFPTFIEGINTNLVDNEKYNMQQEFDTNKKEFKQNYQLKSNKEAQAFIDNISIKDIDIFAYLDSPTLFVDFFSEIGTFVDIMIEIYENLVFPNWYNFWKKRGIDETRQNVQNVYDNLKQANHTNLGNLIAWTNAALNVSHQNGSMLEYVSQDTGEDYIQDLLDSLTEGKYISNWNQELYDVGIKV
jgi:hypothetical protein